MIKKQLCNARQLQTLMRVRLCLVVDCRFDLTNPEKGRSDWFASRIPGARYAHLDQNLAAPITSGTGRHPLPEPAEFARFLSSIGWSPDLLLVAYDDASNAVAARLWWLMRYFNQQASLLDGGLAAWKRAGLPLESGPAIIQASDPVKLVGQRDMIVSSQDIAEGQPLERLQVLDARASERFSGTVEPLDKKAGHIPGSINRPFQMNLDESSCFKDPDELRKEFETLLAGRKPSQVAHSCGSGVTACHNHFAMELAGLSPSKLYPGSWSEWITDPARPIETGPAT
jgi:thiosulfate/3-mercaptopyruvate sulfurtransferase